MNAQDFIEAVKLVVRDGAAEGVLSMAENPPGRGVTTEAKARAQWLKSLSHHDREQVLKLVEEGVDSAIFGLLCVIDGVRAVEDCGDKGSFELHYVKHGLSTPLNPENLIFLHDLFN
ncbi:hypothetical protein SAMN05518865_1215 [Duganella sp. CF458]|uniref:hypothetical protein n=1 Tax=Duganella sp. CF458 TaxID=1884368 RepID=UPI0008F0926D|nr:hypothetical protein [Duganella sp. CF458]SFG87234.1 hypothetical protein SAMN05518865_1215 [Duganella sp. CF458]